jgi:hypothetical protein
VIKFHPGGEMDLASLSVIGTTRDTNPYNTVALWVEDQKNSVVYLQEGHPYGGFAVAPHLKHFGTRSVVAALPRATHTLTRGSNALVAG